MRTRSSATTANSRADARRGSMARERHGDGGAWRSHTFSDGVCSITLTAALDPGLADRLRERLRQLAQRGCDRLILDLTAALEPGGEAPALLARLLAAHPPSCEVVVVVPRRSALDELLPARIAVAWSLSDARRLLASPPAGRRARRQRGPAGAIAPADRHALAVRQALRWAAQMAGAGDYESALRALATIEGVEGSLAPGWRERRQAWLAASGAQAERTGRAAPGARAVGSGPG
jgi:hypothetical protein